MAYRCMYQEGESDPCGHLLVRVEERPNKVRHACPTCKWFCTEETARALCPEVPDDVKDEDLPPLKHQEPAEFPDLVPADTRGELVGDPPDAPVPGGKGGNRLGVKLSAKERRRVVEMMNA